MGVTQPVPTSTTELLEHIQELCAANMEFRGDVNAQLEHIGFMIQKTLIIEQRILTIFAASNHP